MLRELCKTFETPNHNSYQRGLHTQPADRTYTMTLQHGFDRKSIENRRLCRRFIRYFVIKAPTRRLNMLRELCGTF